MAETPSFFLTMMVNGQPGLSVWASGPSVAIGRSEDCGINLDDKLVSRQHARILLEGGLWYLEDVQSTNPTLINGQPIRGRSVLYKGDVLKMGSQQYTFHPEYPLGISRPTAVDGTKRRKGWLVALIIFIMGLCVLTLASVAFYLVYTNFFLPK